MDDHNVIDLLRQFADCLEHPDLERNPLGEIEDLGKDAVPKLIEALGHGDAQIRRMAVCALGCLHSPHGSPFDLTPAAPRLQQLLRTDPDSLTRLYAAEALWMICEHEAAIRVFVSGLKDSRVEARRFAAGMLGVVGAEAADALEPLTKALDDPDLLVRRSAAEGLGSFGSAARHALPTLEEFLDEDEWTRLIGAEAILRIEPSRTKELSAVLVQSLRSKSPRIRQSATQALGELPAAGELAVHALVDALEDDEESVSMGAMWALESLGPAAAPAVDALIAILRGDADQGDDLLIRGMAAAALGQIGPAASEAIPVLLDCLEEFSDHCTTRPFELQVARALWMIEREPRHLVEIGVEGLSDPDWWVRRTAAHLLGDLGPTGEEVLPYLRQAIDDDHPAVRRQATNSVKKIAGA